MVAGETPALPINNNEREMIVETPLTDQKLLKMVDDFAEAMKSKLLEKQQYGYYGFDDPLYQGQITQKLKRNVREKDWVDVGALAAMRWLHDDR